MNSNDESFVSELRDSTAHGHPGHAVLLGQIRFAGQPRIWRELASPDIPLDVPGNLGSHGNRRIVTYPVRSVVQ